MYVNLIDDFYQFPCEGDGLGLERVDSEFPFLSVFCN